MADAGENAVAVVDLGTRRVRGFIPTAWYPADVQITPDGRAYAYYYGQVLSDLYLVEGLK